MIYWHRLIFIIVCNFKISDFLIVRNEHFYIGTHFYPKFLELCGNFLPPLCVIIVGNRGEETLSE